MSKEIPIICPNCGAHAYYPEGGHVAVCPYCDCRVVIDDAESEIKLDNLQKETNLLRDKAMRREALDKDAAEYERRLKKWRNYLRGALVYEFFSTVFSFVIFGNDDLKDREELVTPAALAFLAAIILFFAGPPILGVLKPRSVQERAAGKRAAAETLVLTLKLYGYCFASALCGAFLACFIYEFIL